MLTQERLKELMSYNPDTGIFTRNKSAGGKRKGSIVGSVHSAGYIETQVDGCRYYCHRLAFLYMTGSIPDAEVDHINRKPSDNRWSNLRLVDRSKNNMNTKAKGYYHSHGAYCAQIRVNNKVYYLGRFKSEQAARDAYVKAGRKLHGKFFCDSQ